MDEWDLSAVFTGHLSVWDLAAGHHSEHRYPLGQLAWYGLTALAGYDFRAAMLANLALMSGLAYGLTRVAARVGGPHPADVLFPALLLNFGHTQNWVIGYHLTLTLPLAALGGVLAAAAYCRPGTEARTALVAGLLLLVVMTGGVYGLAAVPPVAAWVGLLAWRTWRAGQPGTAVAVASPAVVAVMFLGFCVATFPWGITDRPPLLRWQSVLAGLQGLGMVLGFGIGTHYFPWAGVAVLAGLLAAAGRAIATAVTDPDERPRAVGLLAVQVGVLIAALGVVVSRGGFSERHTLPMGFLGCAVVLTLRVYPLPARRWVTAVAGAGLAAAIVAGNWQTGVTYGELHRFHYRLLRDDLRAGMPVGFVVAKHPHALSFNHSMTARLAQRMEALRVAGIGWFRDARPTPAMAAVPADPVRVRPVTFRGPDRPSTPVPAPGRFLHGMSVRLRTDTPAYWAEVVAEWPAAGGTGRANVYARLEPGEQEVMFWVNAAPTQVTFRTTAPTGEVTVADVVWLVPPGR
jgi:hypothetical protein